MLSGVPSAYPADTSYLDRVTSLEMSPMDDTFLSASEDDTVRMWDLRSNTAQVRETNAHSKLVGANPDLRSIRVC